jgi:FKBP-type peptidyl-prolyl cis-trans isomerase (trigger factor)
MDEDTYKENNVKPIATKRLKWELILNKLDELEKIEISEDEIKTEIDTILARFSSEDVLSRLKELYVPNSRYYEELKQRIRYRKIIDSFFED